MESAAWARHECPRVLPSRGEQCLGRRSSCWVPEGPRVCKEGSQWTPAFPPGSSSLNLVCNGVTLMRGADSEKEPPEWPV